MNKSSIQKYFFNTSWLLLEKILRIFLGLFIGIWVARYLGPDDFGLLQYAISLVALCGAFTMLGLDGILVKKLVNEPENESSLLGSALALRLAAGTLLIMIVLGLISFSKAGDIESQMLLIISLYYVFSAFEVFEYFFQAKVKGKVISIVNSASYLLSSSLKLIAIFLGLPLVWFAVMFVAEKVFQGLLLCLAYIKTENQIRILTVSKRKSVELIKEGWPLILSSMVIMVYMRVDQVMLKIMDSPNAVGQYSAAVKVSEAWYFVPMIIAQSLFPAILNAKKKSETVYLNRLQALYSLMVAVGLFVSFIVSFLGQEIILFLYTEVYIEAAPILILHIWAGIFVSLGVGSSRWFLAENLQKLAFWRTFWGMIINLLLNILFIEKYGAVGAALATIASQAFAAYLFDAFDERTRGQFKIKTNAFLLKGLSLRHL